MKNSYASADDFAKDVARSARHGWINGTFDVNGAHVGIKAYGRWIQRITRDGATDGGDFRTQRAMRDFIVSFIEN